MPIRTPGPTFKPRRDQLARMSSEGDLEVVDRWPGGVGWTLADDRLQRTSHALAVGGSVDLAAEDPEPTAEDPEPTGDADLWLCDPVDAAGLDDLLAEYGDVAGVVLQLDRHHRDSAAIARRHDVAVHLPGPLAGEADDLDCETAPVGDELADTGFESFTIVDNRLWREAGLYHPGRGTLVVPEAVGTAELFRAGDEPLGVHPALRLLPPRRALGDFAPERILVGHGGGVFTDAAAALQGALRRSRRGARRVYWKALREVLG